MAEKDSNLDAARAFVDFGMAEQAAGRRESASGPGSALEAARPTLEMLARVIPEQGITSVLDLGCGDWNWMRHLGLPHVGGQRLRYTGWEASEALVSQLQDQFATPEIRFRLGDLTTEPFPQTDLVILRDVLFHLPQDMALRVLARLRRTTRFLITTSFLGMPENEGLNAYLTIEGWGFYPINLAQPPFSLAPFLLEARAEPLCSARGQPRFVCLFQFR
ncbi:class I SAM-dependent methyltransferase [Pseudooceanicola sp. CBS1P-1]|uniref:Methyltransferase domain-containing protein n=1 Tax=Pseudooceanicola albus TaxID=2692189 RepID=A0A6L7G090_9RHOB|nr:MULTISPECIES: class I SAM-dependent methyltransferase [Pseudooceanicola]MBT9382571.1 class I SAM-dependent methyltransferase [Pseudooceanicola endophyticus]MXN17112.1 methyltransferase domain-containing protein [Pseudooceanicola albus]